MPLSEEEKRERNRIRCKKYYEKNKQKLLEQQKEYYENNQQKCREKRREYYENNQEKRKEYLEKNKEKIQQYTKTYREKNKEHIKEYSKTPKGTKSKVISLWKRRGLICEDYDSLYCHYSLATECDNCNITFGEKGDGSGTHKCMDHSHTTGKFRNFLCNKCNLLRGE